MHINCLCSASAASNTIQFLNQPCNTTSLHCTCIFISLYKRISTQRLSKQSLLYHSTYHSVQCVSKNIPNVA